MQDIRKRVHSKKDTGEKATVLSLGQRTLSYELITNREREAVKSLNKRPYELRVSEPISQSDLVVTRDVVGVHSV